MALFQPQAQPHITNGSMVFSCLLRLPCLQALDSFHWQGVCGVNGPKPLIAHQRQASNAEKGVIHVCHVIGPVTDAPIILILHMWAPSIDTCGVQSPYLGEGGRGEREGPEITCDGEIDVADALGMKRHSDRLLSV